MAKAGSRAQRASAWASRVWETPPPHILACTPGRCPSLSRSPTIAGLRVSGKPCIRLQPVGHCPPICQPHMGSTAFWEARRGLGWHAASPVGLYRLDVAHKVLGQADAEDLQEGEGMSGAGLGQEARGGGADSRTCRRATPTKTPATTTRLSCSHFSNWPTQPLVWMEPCCSSSWG